MMGRAAALLILCVLLSFVLVTSAKASWKDSKESKGSKKELKEKVKDRVELHDDDVRGMFAEITVAGF